MKQSGITEKNMQNKRFSRTELAIFAAYYSFRDYPSARMLACRAHISRSTLYRHHRKVQSIPHDYETFLLKKYRKAIRRYCHRDNFRYQQFFLRFLTFIMNNKIYFLALFKDNRKAIIIEMLRSPKPQILAKWHLDGDMSKMYSVYTNEVLGAIEAWAKHNFSKDKLEQSLGDILFLTKSARSRLLPLLEEKS